TRRVTNNASGLIRTASARPFTSVAKAVSMLLFVLAVTTSSCRPMAEAAVCNSDKKGSVMPGLSGLTSTKRGVRKQLVPEPKPLCFKLHPYVTDPSGVSAWPIEAGNKTDFHGIGTNDEDNRDRRGRCLGRERRCSANRCNDDI